VLKSSSDNFIQSYGFARFSDEGIKTIILGYEHNVITALKLVSLCKKSEIYPSMLKPNFL
jgi:hypothetical protein